MTTKPDRQQKPTDAKSRILWCNFCGYTADDLDQYLKHSCKEILEQSGQKMEPTGQNECR
jgi:hypothetical protein